MYHVIVVQQANDYCSDIRRTVHAVERNFFLELRELNVIQSLKFEYYRQS